MRRLIWAAIPMCFVTGCVSVAVNDSALCAGFSGPATDHAGALAEDAGPQSVVTGARLIHLIDAGCGVTPTAAGPKTWGTGK
jgi:hypothetical protein